MVAPTSPAISPGRGSGRSHHPHHGGAARRLRGRPLALVGAAALVANLWLLRCGTHSFAASGTFADAPTAAWNGTANVRSEPSVACFFMVDRQSLDAAVSVRYSRWGRRCAQFAIFSNGVAGGEQWLDGNTLIADVRRVIQSEMRERNIDTTNIAESTLGYTTFPSPDDETKQYLTLKSFYCWMHMARKYGDRVDYIMKVDPDTHMLMDNYFRYLSRYYSPEQNAYVGRVFKTGGNHRDPFVTGLSCTLSRTTAKLLVAKSTIQTNDINPECSAELFANGGEADDHTLSQCLSSFGVYPAYTRDNLGRERFLHFNPSEHVFGNDEPPDWYQDFSFTPHRPRSACCSEEACAFHYVEPKRQNQTLVWDKTFGVWHWKEGA